MLPWSRKIGWIFSHFYSSYNKNLISPINKLLYRRSSGAHACAYQISESVHGFVLVVLFVYTLHILIFSRNKKVISIKFLHIFPLLSITRYTYTRLFMSTYSAVTIIKILVNIYLIYRVICFQNFQLFEFLYNKIAITTK